VKLAYKVAVPIVIVIVVQASDISGYYVTYSYIYCIVFGAKISSKLSYNFYFKNCRRQDTTSVTLILYSFNHLTVKYTYV
jgi:hypothetical protein